jgi:hypothetical protein
VLAAAPVHDYANTRPAVLAAWDPALNSPRIVRFHTPLVAFVDVTVIPMDRERTLEHQTVIVRGERITAVGPAKAVRVPAGALRVEGRGKYLLPGLAEMHAHIPPGDPSEQEVRDILFLYIANGVTTIRGMLGAPYQIPLRDRIAKGEILGPTLFVGAPSLNGNTAPDPETAERLVREYKAAGYDFLKLHPGLSRATYDRIVMTARELGITFAGHVSGEVGIRHTLASRQSTIDHLDGYLQGVVADSVSAPPAGGGPDVVMLARHVDGTKIEALARATRDARVWNVPTLHLWENLYGFDSPERMAARLEMKYVAPLIVAEWMKAKRKELEKARESGLTPGDVQRFLEVRRAMFRGLVRAGAGILMGTDSPQLFMVPGFALLRELRIMTESGMTPFEVLETGTRNVATYAARDLELDGNVGTVAVGNRADLVLLDANPLADLSNLEKRAGVMVRGRWLPRAEIEKGLTELAARHAQGQTGEE